MGGRAYADGSDIRASVRDLVTQRRHDEAWALLRPLLLGAGETAAWDLARTVVRSGKTHDWAPPAKRQIRLAVLCSYEAAELAAHLELGCEALWIDVELYLAPFGQLEQEVLDPSSGLAGFRPTHVLIAPTVTDLGFSELAEDGAQMLDIEEGRWRRLWDSVHTTLGARVVQHSFVVPDESPFGHLALRLPASRTSLVRELNARLGAAAGASVLLVDCDRLASRIGKHQWFDPRLWYAIRQPYSYAALPLLARETAAVLAGDVGLGARCVVLDLDNTLWGGIVGEEGPQGVVIGEGPDGEAFAAFQTYLGELGRRGTLLAVASKNDAEAARAPFEQNPRMQLRLDDFAAFVADWRRKPEQLIEIADTLGLGLDALIFADDNPAECAEVAASLPEIETVVLSVPPSEFVRTLAASPRLELSALTDEDRTRRSAYRGRAAAESLLGSVASLEDFWRSLEMRARIRDVDEETLERAAQLTQKTNQFNLTLVRRTVEDLRRIAAEPTAILRTIALEDRFTRHGIVGLIVAVPAGDDSSTLAIDSLLLSCRVIGRTAELHVLANLSRTALDIGYARLQGSYAPGPRNALVADLYPRLGFQPILGLEGVWNYDLAAKGPLQSDYIGDLSDGVS